MYTYIIYVKMFISLKKCQIPTTALPCLALCLQPAAETDPVSAFCWNCCFHTQTNCWQWLETNLQLTNQCPLVVTSQRAEIEGQCLLSSMHTLKSGASNGSGGWTFVIFMEFADRQGHRLIIENHWWAERCMIRPLTQPQSSHLLRFPLYCF